VFGNCGGMLLGLCPCRSKVLNKTNGIHPVPFAAKWRRTRYVID
jgi:hypothetical protein